MNLFNDLDRHHINTYNILPEPQVDDKLLDFILRYREVSIINYYYYLRSDINHYVTIVSSRKPLKVYVS